MEMMKEMIAMEGPLTDEERDLLKSVSFMSRKYKDLSDNGKLIFDSWKSGKIVFDGSMSQRKMVEIICGKDNRVVRSLLGQWIKWELYKFVIK